MYHRRYNNNTKRGITKIERCIVTEEEKEEEESE